MKDEQKKLYKEWRSLINMSATELQKFLDSDEGKEAGLSKEDASKLGIHRGRDSARAIIRMKDKKVDEWNAGDWEWAKRQVSFVSRMLGNPGPLFKDGKKTRKHTSLLIWGHNPKKSINECYAEAERILNEQFSY